MLFKWKRKTDRIPPSPERMKIVIRLVLDGSTVRGIINKYHMDKWFCADMSLSTRTKGMGWSSSPNLEVRSFFCRRRKQFCRIFTDSCSNELWFYVKRNKKIWYLYALQNKKQVPIFGKRMKWHHTKGFEALWTETNNSHCVHQNQQAFLVRRRLTGTKWENFFIYLWKFYVDTILDQIQSTIVRKSDHTQTCKSNFTKTQKGQKQVPMHFRYSLSYFYFFYSRFYQH